MTPLANDEIVLRILAFLSALKEEGVQTQGLVLFVAGETITTLDHNANRFEITLKLFDIIKDINDDRFRVMVMNDLADKKTTH